MQSAKKLKLKLVIKAFVLVASTQWHRSFLLLVLAVLVLAAQGWFHLMATAERLRCDTLDWLLVPQKGLPVHAHRWLGAALLSMALWVPYDLFIRARALTNLSVLTIGFVLPAVVVARVAAIALKLQRER